MGFVLLEFLLQCFTVLAWPFLAWVYPLCCSIRATENNSISDTQMLNTYWVVLSLILLFEHAFLKLLEWLLLWQYIRIMIVYWLVIPHFDGAVYVYKHLICPCLTVDPQIVINWFKKRRNASSCIQENGPEALERIVACKVIQAEHNLTGTGTRKFATMEIKEKAIEVVAERNILKTPPLYKFQKRWTFNSHIDSKNLKNATKAPKARNQTQPRLTQIGNGALAAVKDSVNPVEIATGRELIESSQNVPKEWIRALEVTIPSETTLNSHPIRIEKAAYETLNAKSRAYLPKMALAKSDKHASKPKVIINRKVQAREPENSIPSSPINPEVIINRKAQAGEPEQSIPSCGSKPKWIINRKVQAEEPERSIQSSGLKPKWIISRTVLADEPENTVPSSGSKPKAIINPNMQAAEEPSEGISCNELKRKLIITLKGKMQGQQQNPNEAPRMKDHRVWCKICNVHCPGEIDLASHLKGRKHEENVLEQLHRANRSKDAWSPSVVRDL